jgi:hypothetical protein
MNLFLDMDGVLVDLARGFKDVCGYPLSWGLEEKIGKEKYWTPVHEARPNFWSTLPKMVGADDMVDGLLNNIHLNNVHILSAVFNDHEECEDEKRVWVQNNTPVKTENINIVQRREKRNFAKTDGVPNVLVDDMEKNCVEWVAAGGIAILHTCPVQTVETFIEIRNEFLAP